ncbi:MAG: MauE/DoxX family redox-associated membrane protein [Phycisphaerales bacterium]
MPTTLRLVQVGIGLLLVYAAYSKTQGLPMFAFILQQSIPFLDGLTTDGLFRVAHGVVFIESLLGLCLIVGFSDRVVRWLAVVLFLMFSGVLAGMLMRDQPLSCGCLGISPNGLGTRAQLIFGLARNGFLIGLLMLIIVQTNRQFAESHHTPSGQRDHHDA